VEARTYGRPAVVLSLVLLLGPQPLWIDAVIVWPLAALALGAMYLDAIR
jgi:hypothetical protein